MLGQQQNNLKDCKSYDPVRLLDTLIEKFSLKNDAALSQLLELPPPVISKIRRRRSSVSAFVLLRIHETCEISIKELRELMGDFRDRFRETTQDLRSEAVT